MKHQAIILLGIVGFGLLYGVLCFSEGPTIAGSHDMVCTFAFSPYMHPESSLSLIFILPFAGVSLIRPFRGVSTKYVSSLFRPPQAHS